MTSTPRSPTSCVLLLTIVWDRDWLTQLPVRYHGTGPNGVPIWTKPAVRYYTLAVTTILLAAIALSLLVLSDLLGDTPWLRVVLLLATALALATPGLRRAGVIKTTA